MAERDATGSDEGQRLWDARLAAMVRVLGEADDAVRHALVPIELGGEAGGAADILCFRRHLDGAGGGFAYATCDLIGRPQQRANAQGQYELMVCHRQEEEDGPQLIARLACYTLEPPPEGGILGPGETMDIGPATPPGSTVAAFLFCDYARLAVEGQRAGLLLCLGITRDELKACRRGRRQEVEAALKAKGVWPFTEWKRKSVLKRGWGGFFKA